MSDISKYKKYYDLETYLFNDVHKTFGEKGVLSAFDFFCIVIWKANRVKSKIAEKLLRKCNDLEKAVSDLTSKIYSSADTREKLRCLANIKTAIPGRSNSHSRETSHVSAI